MFTVTPTQEMLVNGARSIGNSINEVNHLVRARKCFDAMQAAWRCGYVEPEPKNKAGDIEISVEDRESYDDGYSDGYSEGYDEGYHSHPDL